MSRYPPSDYRGPRDRSRSPPRFPDRRPSVANVFDNRPPPPARAASDAPRGPRSHLDGPRAPPNNTLGAAGGARSGYSSLRDAPPLGSGIDRSRPFREREYDRRERLPSRSPPRNFKDSRDYPPRDLDAPRARRLSRDGSTPAGSAYPEGSNFGPSSFRGGLGRGRGRGDYDFRGGRGGRRPDDRDSFRRDRSPPRWTGRDERDLERRDDRRFDRREEDRRADWLDREREVDRARRDPPPRPDSRPLIDSPAGTPTHYPSTAPVVDPGRLAMIEGAVPEGALRRPGAAPSMAPSQTRRDMPDTPSYLNGRAETTANRYNQRGSSPPTQAPPVPAFTLSFAPSGSLLGVTPNQSTAATTKADVKPIVATSENVPASETARAASIPRPTPSDASNAAQLIPSPATKAPVAEPPPSAPKAPRTMDANVPATAGGRLHGVRSLESFAASEDAIQGKMASPPLAPSTFQPLSQPVSPHNKHVFSAPTGPRASRTSPAQVATSPRGSFVSPRLDQGNMPVLQSLQGPTSPPPPSAPTAPRLSSYSVSPKVSHHNIPTAPKADRLPPAAPRSDRAANAPSRPVDRFGSANSWAPPAAPRNAQWNQWRRPTYPGDKTVPAKRDYMGEEKERANDRKPSYPHGDEDLSPRVKVEDAARLSTSSIRTNDPPSDRMAIDTETTHGRGSQASNHSARQSFFGKPSLDPETPGLSDAVDDVMTSSEDDDLDPEEDAALFNAKFERQKRALEAQLADLSARGYRATTPLESIARLTRISLADLQRLTEHQETDVVSSPTVSRQLVAPTTTQTSESEENHDILTPKGEDDGRVNVQDTQSAAPDIRNLRRRSPEVINLPFLTRDGQPFDQNEILKDDLKRLEDSKDLAVDALQVQLINEDEDQADIEDDFIRLYRQWREECESLDWEAEEQERRDRQQSQEPGPEADATVAPAANSSEGRRLLKFSSEYDIEQVLKQSEETARIEQERLERESKRLQADLEKEAIAPDQLTEAEFKRDLFIDSNRFRDPESLTLVFTFEPPADTFTEEEQRIFIAAYKETPKKWGEIASLLPGRSYKDCIHHYYANKWDCRFRDSRTKKMKAGGRRGRGGKSTLRGRGSALMADLGRTEDLTPTMVSDSGRPKRAAAPTTFGEREPLESKSMVGVSPAKRAGPGSKGEANGDEKPAKRRRGAAGEKPGRKAKGPPPLAAIAAAPAEPPEKPFVPMPQVKEDPVLAQNLEDATLLAGFQAGRHNAYMSDNPSIRPPQDVYSHMVAPSDDPAKPRPMPQTASARPNASSYWSVPEQTDFAKYIAYFGTDFAAIAAHMGTKTQTMIKNHYQRQIDGGARPGLEHAARDADQRRERGEDMGAPPTPSPIVKRKYDNAQPMAPRTLAPHKDSMEIDDHRQVGRVPQSLPKHGSPPQFQSQPRFTAASHATPTMSQRTMASPVPANATPGLASIQAAQSRASVPPTPVSTAQHQSFGNRLTFFSEPVRPDARSAVAPSSAFRSSQDMSAAIPSRNQPPQPTRPNAADPQYISGLVAQQDQALRVQQEQSQQERFDQNYQRQRGPHYSSAQASPAIKTLQAPTDRLSERAPERVPLSFSEDRGSTPPRSFPPASGLSRPLMGQTMFAQLGAKPYSPGVPARPPYATSPPRREEPRPNSVPATVPHASLAMTPTSAPEPPKRSNLLSILNSEPDEPAAAPKRDPAPPRTASPAMGGYPPPASNPGSVPRRDLYGPPPTGPSQYNRPAPYATARETAGSVAPPLPKVESASSSQPLKQDWTSRVLTATPQPDHASPPSHERDMRPYWSQSHRSAPYGNLGQPPSVNPSPPPHGVLGHSRTPSLTTQSLTQSRDQSGLTSGQPRPQTPLQAIPALQPSAYGQRSTQPSYTPPTSAPNHSHHAHNPSVGGGYPAFHHRAPSRDEPLRSREAAYEREEQDWRRRSEAIEMERQREREREHERERELHAQRQQDLERQQQHAYSRGGPPPPGPASHMPLPGYGPPPSIGQSRMSLGLRDQSIRDAEAAHRAAEDEQRHMAIDAERRRQDAMLSQQQQQPQQQHREHPDDYRRRQDEAHYARRTPLGPGGYAVPPPPPPGSMSRR